MLTKGDLIPLLKKVHDVYQGKGYVFVGGVAEVLRGFKKHTKDIDILVVDPLPMVKISDNSLLYHDTCRPLCYVNKVMVDIKVVKELENSCVVSGFNVDILSNAILHKIELLNSDIDDKERIKVSGSLDNLVKVRKTFNI